MAAAEQTRLAAELEFYGRHKREWLRLHPGEYVVIKGPSVLGFYSGFEAAYRAGAETWGVDSDFLVKQVLEHEPVFLVF